MKKETIKIEYLDSQASTFPFESWKPAVLVLDSETLQITDAFKKVLSYQFQDISSVALVTLTGGEPARYTLISVTGNELISIRPKRRYFRLLKQANELNRLGESLNAKSGRGLVDTGKVKNLQIVTLLGSSALTVLVLLALFNMLKSL